MHTFLGGLSRKYLYMSRTIRHINHNITNEVSHAILQQPTNATFVSKETLQIDEKKEGLRQTGQNVYA